MKNNIYESNNLPVSSVLPFFNRRILSFFNTDGSIKLSSKSKKALIKASSYSPFLNSSFLISKGNISTAYWATSAPPCPSKTPKSDMPSSKSNMLKWASYRAITKRKKTIKPNDMIHIPRGGSKTRRNQSYRQTGAANVMQKRARIWYCRIAPHFCPSEPVNWPQPTSQSYSPLVSRASPASNSSRTSACRFQCPQIPCRFSACSGTNPWWSSHSRLSILDWHKVSLFSTPLQRRTKCKRCIILQCGVVFRVSVATFDGMRKCAYRTYGSQFTVVFLLARTSGSGIDWLAVRIGRTCRKAAARRSERPRRPTVTSRPGARRRLGGGRKLEFATTIE